MTTRYSEVFGGGGGQLGSAPFNLGLDMVEGENVKLAEDGNIYPYTYANGQILTTTPNNYGTMDAYKSVEVATDRLVILGGLVTSTETNGFLYGASISGRSITNDDVEITLYDESTSGQKFPDYYDIASSTAENDKFLLSFVGDDTANDQLLVQAGTYNGTSISVGSVLNIGASASGGGRTTISTLNTLSSSNRGIVSFSETDNIRAVAVANATSSDVVTNAGSSNITFTNHNINAAVSERLTDTRCIILGGSNTDSTSPSFQVVDDSASAIGSLTVVDAARTLTADLPVGVVRSSDTDILIATVTGWQFNQDQEGFSGVTNPVQSTSGQVLSIYAVTTANNWTSVTIGTPLKVDPVVSEKNGGASSIHIIKDSDNNFEVIYNGIVHKVSVDFSTRTVTNLFEPFDLRHDAITQVGQSFTGSTFYGSSLAIGSLNPISSNRYMYSDTAQSSGSIQLFEESLFKAGSKMPIGELAASGSAGSSQTVRIDARVNSKDTGATYTVGEITNRIPSSDTRNLFITANRSLTASVIAENIPEYEEILEYPEWGDCYLLNLQELGWSTFSGSSSSISGVYSLDQSLNGIQPLREFINISGAGVVRVLGFTNLGAAANDPDFDVIIDGELWAHNRNETVFNISNEGYLIGNRASGITRADSVLPFKKSLIIRARNRSGEASSQSVRVISSIYLRK